MLDGDKLFRELANDPTLRGIPIIYITKIAISLIKILNDGQCFLELED